MKMLQRLLIKFYAVSPQEMEVEGSLLLSLTAEGPTGCRNKYGLIVHVSSFSLSLMLLIKLYFAFFLRSIH
jgi:hypothetical protein